MRKMIKISIAVMCAGVLLSGIGTGVAIAEYTSLEYTGRHNFGEESLIQESIDMVVAPVEGKKIMVLGYYHSTSFVYDESVPINTVRYKVHYNPEQVSVRGVYIDEEYDDQEMEEEQKYQGEVRLSVNYFGNEFDLFMKNKDYILSELKQGKIGSYDMKDIEDIEVLMNPRMKDYVEIIY